MSLCAGASALPYMRAWQVLRHRENQLVVNAALQAAQIRWPDWRVRRYLWGPAKSHERALWWRAFRRAICSRVKAPLMIASFIRPRIPSQMLPTALW
eukprot:14565237-Alexandrium_andersonii.AAC.1